jgi:ribosome-associated protein
MEKYSKTELKDLIVDSIKERKGKEIVVLDLRELEQSIADYFVICHGDSNTQVGAIADFVDREVRTKLNEHPINKEGLNNSQWVLFDYADVVVHIFQEEYRQFYNLEELWADAKKELIIEE